MYKTIVLVFICLFCFLTSCRTSRQENQKIVSTKENYIQQKETYRDTLLFVPKSETSLIIPTSEILFKPGLNDISKPKTFIQKNGNATAKVQVTPSKIIVVATCDSLQIAAKIKTELYKQISATARNDTKTDSKKSGYSLITVLKAFFVGLVVGAVIMFILKTLKIV